ncbi:MAG TPA: tetratricopeptide repeat protein [Vicinamibacteria bacterium]|nr:tetratricopeptide repeat protein [Vicinamibacteria bacterium]
MPTRYGLCLWRLGRTSEAAALFERMLGLSPSEHQGICFLLAEVKAGKSWKDSNV